jgi:ribonuclease P protein component
MLSKINRADKKAVEKVFKEGVFIRSGGLNLKYVLKNNKNTPQISFIAPKSVEKQAVKRNYLRRCGYDGLRKYLNKIPNGFVGVFIFGKIKGNIYKKTEEEINLILNKLKFVNKN